ncbi:MAG: ABC transporter substrate-binding protein [Deltaproteobacteria bacterium]|nr:ABC transporter substrate-binding protein [Deltaproteobacteria bacterium]
MIKKCLIFFHCILLSFSMISMASAAKEAHLLRLALLPIPSVLPIFVAEESGYFKESGITVETLPVGSAVERDQLMQAGRIDGMINEISGAAIFNRDKVQLKIIAIARSPIGDRPIFRILAAPGSSYSGVKDLAGIPVGISKNTIIEYITGRLLQAGGVEGGGIHYQSVPVLPERLQLLLSGQIKAATLPDPLAASAIAAGAVEIVNDTALAGLSASVISFSAAALADKTDAVKKFMVAWDRAAADLNADPAKYKELMLKKIRVPGNVQVSFTIPPYPRKRVPNLAQWDDVMDWMVEKKLLSAPLVYGDSVTSDFLAR